MDDDKKSMSAASETDQRRPRVWTAQVLLNYLRDAILVSFDPLERWVVDFRERCIRNIDGRAEFDVRMFARGNGVEQPGIFDEPTAGVHDRGKRIVGYIVIELNSKGRVRVVKRRGLDGGDFYAAPMWSLSDPGAPAPPTHPLRVAYVRPYPERVGGGYYKVLMVSGDVPDEAGRTVEELRRGHHGPTLAALFKLGL